MRTGITYQEQRQTIHIHYSEKNDILLKPHSLKNAAMAIAEKNISADDIDEMAGKINLADIQKIEREHDGNEKEITRLVSILNTPEEKKRTVRRAKNLLIEKKAIELSELAHLRCIKIANEMITRIEDEISFKNI